MINQVKWHVCLNCQSKCIGLKPKCYCNKKESISNTELMDLGTVPPELMFLSTIEELLISKVYRLRGGQIGYSGHVIIFFQDVHSFAKVLPYTIADISGVVKICCKTKSFHKDFNIRKEVVLNALRWLKANDDHYHDIVIDLDVLSKLPDQFESEVTDDLPIDSIGQNEDDLELQESESDSIISSLIPQPNMCSTEEKVKHHLKWPELENHPISELGKSKYIVQAFPTLFPYGRGDISMVTNHKFTAREYFQYLMNYKDSRFSSHKIFPYFAWNSVMRWECLTKGTVYMKKLPEFKKVNVNLLKVFMKCTPDIGKDVMVYSSSIRSSRDFWYSRSSELQDMVKQIGLPTIFFTLSAADFHWPRLYDLLKEISHQNELNETERHNLMFNNPKICSDYFFEVAEIFINSIIIPHFNVKDHWYRYEWQLRGSHHVHGVLCFVGAVNVKELQSKFNEVKLKVIQYFEKFISCQNPNTNFVQTADHPCRTRIEDVSDYSDDLAALVNTVQRHTVCSTKTCLKLNKQGNIVCKHNFPKVLRETSDIIMNPRKYFEFEGKRNDDRLNKFNKFTLVNWRGNHITAVLSEGGFLHYIAKYAAKPEFKSSLFNNVFLTVLSKVAGSTSVKPRGLLDTAQVVPRGLFTKSGQNTLRPEPLPAGFRNYGRKAASKTTAGKRHQKLRPEKWFFHMKLNETEELSDNCNQLLDSYFKRPLTLSKVNLLDFLRVFNTITYKRKRGRPSTVRVFPRLDLSAKRKPDFNLALARQLCILLCPWTSFKALPSTEEEWMNMKISKQLKFESLPYYQFKDESDSACDFSDDDDDLPEKTQDDWMQVQGEYDTSIVTDLGSREIDQSCNWNLARISNEDEEYYLNFIKLQKLTFVKPVAMIPSNVTFNSEQNDILEFVDNLIEKYNETGDFGDLPKFMICQASAGCGKTMVIQGLVHLITEKCGDDFACVIAPTAAAAVNAGRRTIHSSMRIYIGQQQRRLDLNGENLHNFQQKMKNVKFIIVEEFSMVGCRMLSLLNRRCMQMKNSSEFFGGCALLMFGDIKQLPPVGDESLLKGSAAELKDSSKDGYNLFRCVEKVKVLKECHRQTDNQFLKLLENLSHGILDEEDKLLIKSRFEEYLPPDDKFSFKDALHLYMTRAGVQKHNDEKMREMNIPLLNIPAENNSAIASAWQ
ncbi:ATP-dependent DNA helicase RRM3 [Frankliniella fusca]|uniref:ATP-dependent DNA helicase n=1 Tax=Frankliniella fusca TaxID=407009 RepID=A0AAE1HN71_9NEOP|nr:ATP-dependent DNA helicase RRM3 [Frankliniella fusca]